MLMSFLPRDMNNVGWLEALYSANLCDVRLHYRYDTFTIHMICLIPCTFVT